MSRRETLFREIGRLRRELRRGQGLLCLLGTLTAFLVLVLAFTLADLAFHLPAALCWGAWVAALALVGAVAPIVNTRYWVIVVNITRRSHMEEQGPRAAIYCRLVA